MRVLVTGATGFVGRAIVAALRDADLPVRCACRDAKSVPSFPAGVEIVSVGEVGPNTDWTEALHDIDFVIHLVARTHNIGERDGGNLADYRPVNVEGTRQLARSAAAAGVRRLVFMSSIKVNGERTTATPFTAEDPPAPEDAYGISKWEAEQALASVASRTGLETVILRPPLIYGSGVKGNFARLARWVERGIPLPLGSVKNRRSLVALPNLVDLTIHCLSAMNAAGRTFLVSDGAAVSTPELIKLMASAKGVSAKLVPIPERALRFGGLLTGRQAEVDRLIGSLEVDVGPTIEALGWYPPVSIEEGIRQTMAA